MVDIKGDKIEEKDYEIEEIDIKTENTSRIMEPFNMAILILLGLIVILWSISYPNNVSTPPVDDDNKFELLVDESIDVLNSNQVGIAQSFKNNDLKSVEIYAKSFKDNNTIYLNKINGLTVSPSMKYIFGQYKTFLENGYLYGKYLEEGVGNNNESSMKLAIYYKTNADENFKLFINLTRNN